VTGTWSYERAEGHLRSLELFGMRFGLDRMHRLMTALEAPEQRFESIHVVGTNGKSSTARMIAAILERHGRRAGAYLSPHLVSLTERVQVSGRPVGEASFAAAVQRAAHAAELVERTLAEGDRVTQFELLTAAAYVELARSGVDVAVIEAGLGGRFDATNVIPSRVQVLTNVGLEHTKWLGPTLVDIAREKLAVVREGATLVVGPLDAEVAAEARAAAARERARLVAAGEEDPELQLVARGSFQRRNFALARAAAEAFVGELDPASVRAAAAEVTVPGRCEVVAEDPLTIYDGAHNSAGMEALVESLPEIAVGTPTVAVLSILDDKDAAGMLRALLPACDAVVFTASSNPRALPPPTLQSLARQLGFERHAEAAPEPDPSRAVRHARDLAGADGVVLATGSIYLVADLARAPSALRVSLP
jgi:dihydrofolate synthase/folylpolyglutamate synthase